MSIVLKDLLQWKQTNAPRAFSVFDYVHAFLGGNVRHADAAIAVAEIFWPSLMLHDGAVFLSEKFSEARYSELRSTFSSSRDVEYWMNLVSIDGLLDPLEGLSEEHIAAFSEHLSESWRAKLGIDFPDRPFEVLLARDEDTGDTALTICTADAFKGDR